MMKEENAMNRKFTFTLTKEEYLNFLRFQAAHSKRARRIRMWIAISLPVVLCCLLFLFHLNEQLIWDVAVLAVIILWEWLFTPVLLRAYLNRIINEKTMERLKVTGFQKVSVSFLEDKILYKDKKEHSISYRDILRMIPANEVFIFQYKNQGTLLLPYRLFENKEDMTEFFKEFEMAWKPYR